ncbi:MAG: C25 family cysteine peptidase [Pyrinomonadaceae bacterium]
MKIHPSSFAPFNKKTTKSTNRPKKQEHKQNLSVRFVAVIAMAVFGLVGLSVVMMRTAQAAGNFTGTVFQDFNGNGIKDATDPGLGGVTVTAYDSAGTAVATTTSSAVVATLGQYTLNLVAVANATPLRIEFTGAPGYTKSGPVSTSAGASGSSVQFVTATAAAIANINFGLNNPGNYCQANPRLVTNSYSQGSQTGNTRNVIASSTYTASGVNAALTIGEAQASQVGSTWGLAYHRTSNTLFAASYVKRNAGLAPAAQHPGSDGTGAIYRITPGGAVDGTLFVDLDVLFSNATLTGTDPHTDFNPNPPDFDSGAYAAVGKVALGGLAVSEDDQTLYAINLVDRRLYKLPIGSTPTAPAVGAVTSFLVPNPGCTNGVGRPFAVKSHNGSVYVGGVCTAENAGGTAANLSAWVYSFNPATNTFSAAPVLSFPLNYARGCADIGGYSSGGCRTGVAAGSFADWRPWRDTLDLTFPAGYGGGFTAYSQAQLTNIEFIQNPNSGGEDMAIALRDRFADQIGNSDPGPTGTPPNTAPADGSLLNATPAGEIMRASLNASNVWVIEQNSHNASGTATFGPTAGANNQQGPVSTAGADINQTGEFYLDNHPTNHDEISCGGLAFVPGNPELLATVVDPVNLFSGGTSQFSNTTGARTRSYQFDLGAGGFDKADSFGDLEALCNVAPVELGNRVWNDANGDGIQQPSEAVLVGVTVRLMDSTGTTQLSSAVTSATGNYLFSTATGTTTASAIYGLVTLTNSGSYQIRIDTTQAALTGLTTTKKDGDASANGDSRDSDSTQSGTNSIINVTMSGPGANDHTQDFGFAPAFSVGNRVWFDTNNNGQMETAGTPEVGVDGVTVQLVDSFGSVVGTQTTSIGGYYRFDSVIPGTYTVRIAASNFTTGGALVGYQNSTGVIVGTDRRDNGVDSSSPSAAGISSGSIVVASGGMPASEPDITGSGVAAHGPNGDATDNLLVDFGFYKLTLGNLCFNDSNNNGMFGGSDVGLAGCVIKLFQSNGTTEVPVGPDGILGTADDIIGATNQLTTVAGGAYSFSGLTPGGYVVKVTPPAGGFRSANVTAGTTTPDGNVDNDDNGLGVAVGQTTSNAINLAAGAEPTVTNATASTTNNTLDFGFTTAAPTEVKLASFSARTDGADTLITWQTGFEVSNLGYVLYREDASGKLVPVTPSVVAGSALVAGGEMRFEAGLSFAWWDRSQNGQAGTKYWLEAIDLDGSHETFGPFVTELGSLPTSRPPQSKLLSDLRGGDEYKREREFAALSPRGGMAQSRSPKSGGGTLNAAPDLVRQFELAADPSAIKLSVPQSGWFRAVRSQLVAAGLPVGAANSNLQLFLNGVEVPIEVSDADGSVSFYGQGLDTLETGKNVYWLRAGSTPGLRISRRVGERPAARNGTDLVGLDNFAMTVERRDRVLYFSSLLNGEGNNFFGPVLAANPVSQTLYVRDLDVDAGGSANLEISVVGLTVQAHQVQVKLNGTTVGVINSTDRQQPVWNMPVSRSLLVEGQNVVTLQSVGAGSDVSLTDYIRLTYPRQYRAFSGAGEFTVPAGRPVRIGGFGGEKIQVLDVTDPNQPQIFEFSAVSVGQSGFEFNLPGASVDRRLLVTDQNVVPSSVSNLIGNHASTLNVYDGTARQLVMIAPEQMHAALTPLIAQRERQGINTKLVDIEDVFDEFGYGMHTALAVKNFLSHARTHWGTAPDYVLLVGDSTYDPRNYLLQGENDLVPTKLVDTDFMETSSDDWFVDFDNDTIAEMAIGRLPLRTSAQLDVVVAKLLTYDDQPAEAQRKALLVSDTDFTVASQQVAANLPAGTVVTSIYRGTDTDAALRQQLLDGLNSGPAIVNFTGHGQVGNWTGGGLFTLTDPATLTNVRPSIYITLSCLNNFSHDAYQDSIGEALLKSEHGAAAVWGSSGITFSDPQVVMAMRLYGQYSAVAGVRLGDAIRQAKSATYSPDVRRTWLLFGDPTMRLR